MTIRTPNDKTAVNLVKTAFTAAGTKAQHTQALNLVAQLQGYQSWAHKQSVQRLAVSRAPEAAGMTFEQLVQQFAEAPSPGVKDKLEDWKYQTANGDTIRGFADWVASEFEADTGASLHGMTFQVKPCEVSLPDGSTATWHLEQNLSDRWGDLNTVDPEQKPSLVQLLMDEKLLQALQELMVFEDTFISAKDGNLGLLFEIEYYCAESDAVDGDEPEYPAYKDQKATLLAGLANLHKDFPQFEFAVPPPEEVFNGRPAVWGFIPFGIAQELPRETLVQLALKLNNL